MEFVEAFLKKPIITDPSFKNGGRLKFFILVGLFKSYELLKDEFFQEIKTLNARRFWLGWHTEKLFTFLEMAWNL